MTQFNLFDRVRLLEPITLISDMSNAIEVTDVASIGTVGNIVEVLEPGKAFLVELFGDWIVSESEEGLRRAKADDDGAFRETIGVETVYSQQIELLQRSDIVKARLFQLLEELPESLLPKVQEFAESLRDKVST